MPSHAQTGQTAGVPLHQTTYDWQTTCETCCFPSRSLLVQRSSYAGWRSMMMHMLAHSCHFHLVSLRSAHLSYRHQKCLVCFGSRYGMVRTTQHSGRTPCLASHCPGGFHLLAHLRIVKRQTLLPLVGNRDGQAPARQDSVLCIRTVQDDEYSQ